MNILITLCGRGGSKGIPGKNIKLLNGVPLLVYSIRHAVKFSELHPGSHIFLSTDDSEIRKIAKENGLDSDYVRPAFLANDTVGKIEVLNDALKFAENQNSKKYDYLLDLDLTSPARTLKDLREAFLLIENDKRAYNLFSVSKPHKNPYFNVIELSDDGYCKLVKPSDTRSRQTAPQVFDMNASFYFYRRSFFEKGYRSAITERSLHYLMDHICFDLDEPLDFDIMEYLVTQNKLKIEL